MKEETTTAKNQLGTRITKLDSKGTEEATQLGNQIETLTEEMTAVKNQLDTRIIELDNKVKEDKKN